jgi:hypothetical protein
MPWHRRQSRQVRRPLLELFAKRLFAKAIAPEQINREAALFPRPSIRHGELQRSL